MRIRNSFFVLFSTAITVTGARRIVRDGMIKRLDGPGAELYKRQNLEPGVEPQYQIGVPIGFCTDMSDIFGSWTGAVRSVEVYKGYACCFHLEPGCPTTDVNFELGSASSIASNKTLTPEFDKKISSVYCEVIKKN